MTNEELKEKIMKIIDESVDAWAIRDKRGRIHVHIDKLADALIAAGIGDVKEAEAEANRYEMLYSLQSRDMALAERKAYESEHLDLPKTASQNGKRLRMLLPKTRFR